MWGLWQLTHSEVFHCQTSQAVRTDGDSKFDSHPGWGHCVSFYRCQWNVQLAAETPVHEQELMRYRFLFALCTTWRFRALFDLADVWCLFTAWVYNDHFPLVSQTWVRVWTNASFRVWGAESLLWQQQTLGVWTRYLKTCTCLLTRKRLLTFLFPSAQTVKDKEINDSLRGFRARFVRCSFIWVLVLINLALCETSPAWWWSVACFQVGGFGVRCRSRHHAACVGMCFAPVQVSIFWFLFLRKIFQGVLMMPMRNRNCCSQTFARRVRGVIPCDLCWTQCANLSLWN